MNYYFIIKIYIIFKVYNGDVLVNKVSPSIPLENSNEILTKDKIKDWV